MSLQGQTRRVVLAAPGDHAAENLDLERGDDRSVDERNAGILRSISPTISIASDKPHAQHEEYARGHGRVKTLRPAFSRTFTQKIRAAHLEDEDFKNLSQKDKRAVVAKGLRSYFMDTNFKNREDFAEDIHCRI